MSTRALILKALAGGAQSKPRLAETCGTKTEVGRALAALRKERLVKVTGHAGGARWSLTKGSTAPRGAAPSPAPAQDGAQGFLAAMTADTRLVVLAPAGTRVYSVEETGHLAELLMLHFEQA